MVRGGRLFRAIALACLCWLATGGSAAAQLGALLSPGRLSKAHADLEGITNCQSCHERGQRVTAEKCLTCHEPVAERINRKAGVHASVTNDCVSCHVEHAGLDGVLRPFNQSQFDHGGVTGFPIDGKHSRLPGDCAACHKERSFLTLSSSCASCHADVHKGSLGSTCTSCHTTKTTFREPGGTFDHSKAGFPLRGAHQTTACTGCHVDQRFRGIQFRSCTNCHTDPHRQALGPTCTSCHTETSWRTQKLDHNRTNFPLKGLHAEVRCAACHKQSAALVKPKSDTCASCHVDIHRGNFKEDCSSCHTESGFQRAPFDHTTTTFALTGAHLTLECATCHKPALPAGRSRTQQRAARPPSVLDFRGLQATCVSCHEDVHTGELGGSCQTCHATDTFHVSRYTHAHVPEFFVGQHAALTCEQCHVPAPLTRPIRTSASILNVAFTSATTACVSCHRDVHLGQEGTVCETCHTVQTAKFAIVNFEHAQTGFSLTGRHLTTECVLCHKTETGLFPAGDGTAVRFKGVGRECLACHADPHLGQLDQRCETCHDTTTFHLTDYRHRRRMLDDFFTGKHTSANCESCHKVATMKVSAGGGRSAQFQIPRSCVSCHEDKHRGSLGSRCETCHRP